MKKRQHFEQVSRVHLTHIADSSGKLYYYVWLERRKLRFWCRLLGIEPLGAPFDERHVREVIEAYVATFFKHDDVRPELTPGWELAVEPEPPSPFSAPGTYRSPTEKPPGADGHDAARQRQSAPAEPARPV